MELRDYFRVVRHRWRLIVSCVLLAVGAAALVTLRATPQFASTVQLFVSTPQSDSAAAYQGGLFSQQRVTSYADLVSGQEITRRVVERLQLDQSASELSDQISASVVPETVILGITVTDPDAARAQQLATAVADEFTMFVQELETPPGKAQAPIKASVVDPAELPTNPVYPQPLRNIGLATVLGLLVGIGGAVLRETFDTSVRGPEDLAAATDAPVMVSITYDGAAARTPLITALAPHAPRVEAFRVLRTNLQFVDVDRPSKVFVITSSVPGEGKTTTTCNLAITLAQAGQRVALVEGDLRRPKVSEYLRLESVVGVTTVLVGRLELADAVQDWGDHDLKVLTSGAIPPNPSELLQSQAMHDLVASLRRHFDVILIDAPPLLPVTDAAIVAAQADGALLVVRHGKTTRDQISAAVERLEAVGGRLVGVLLNMTPQRGGSGYYYGYGYGYAPTAGRRRATTTSETPADDLIGRS